MMTNQKQIRAAFWSDHPRLERRKLVKMGEHRDYVTDTRCAFCDYVDMLARAGEISEKLAAKVTL